MKRLVVSLALLVPLSLLIAGCGGGGATNTTATKSVEKAQEEGKKTMEEMMKKGKAGAPGATQGKGAAK